MQAPQSSPPAAADADRKLFANLQAHAALAGVRIDPVEVDGRIAYVVSRYNLARPCHSIDELKAFLGRMGVAA